MPIKQDRKHFILDFVSVRLSPAHSISAWADSACCCALWRGLERKFGPAAAATASALV